MERCVRSARAAGVFKEFHVLTDAPIEGCECYDAMELKEDQGLYQLIYLKAAISKLPFEHFVWIDPDTVFASNPSNLLGALGCSPLHVPLEVEVAAVNPAASMNGVSAARYEELMKKCGVINTVYSNRSAFWIVTRDAIDTVCELSMQGWHKAREPGTTFDGNFALGYAMQMLCGDPLKHTVAARPDLWAADYHGRFSGAPPVGDSWEFHDLTQSARIEVRPSIIHLPQSRSAPG